MTGVVELFSGLTAAAGGAGSGLSAGALAGAGGLAAAEAAMVGAAAPAFSLGATLAGAAPWLTAAGSLASAGLAISGGGQQAAMFSAQAAANRVAAVQGAQQAEIAARGEELRGRAEANGVREALLRAIASQRALYAGAGLVADDGTPADIADETRREAERELEIRGANAALRTATTRLEGANRGGALLAEADLLEARGGAARTAGLGTAATSLFDYADRWMARQPGTVRTR